METFKARNVTVWFRSPPWFKKHAALRDFSLELEPGTTTGLIGPNGAGKTTALLGFLGLIRPDRGEYLFAGQPVGRGTQNFENISYLPEMPEYPPYLTVREVLQSYGAYYNTKRNETIENALDYYELVEHADRRISSCSKGLKQRVGLCSLWLGTSDYIFLDEPTRGLDPVMVEKLAGWLRDQQERGATLLINSHVLADIELLSDRVAFLNEGRITLHRPLDELLEEDRSRYKVKVEGKTQWPKYVETVRQEGPVSELILPADRLEQFIVSARERDLTVLACQIQQKSLLDLFREESEKR